MKKGNSKDNRWLRKRTAKEWLSLLATVILLALLIMEYLTPDAIPTDAPALIENGGIIHYIDVGQGDCQLVQTPDGNMLIDTGEYEHVEKLTDYLEKWNVKRIDYLVATHPHSDHIGSMATIIRNFEIGTIIMPRAEGNGISYEQMLLAMKERKLKAHAPVVGETFAMGEAEFTVLAPVSKEYENLNNFSVVLRMLYGEHSFLFTGDAESLSEQEMLKNGLELSADFLKVGHHGSRTSSTRSFLKEVKPKLAFIGVGKGNSYGHPTQTVLDNLGLYTQEIYRTDQHGDIVIETDGRNYRITTGE